MRNHPGTGWLLGLSKKTTQICAAAILCILMAVYATTWTPPSDHDQPPENAAELPTTAPLILLKDGTGTYQPGLHVHSEIVIPGGLNKDAPPWPMASATTLSVNLPLSFLLTSQRYPNYVIFSFVDREDNPLIEPIVCELTSVHTWSEEDDHRECIANADNDGWSIVLNPSSTPGAAAFLTIGGVWLPDPPSSVDVGLESEQRFAFTASWLFHLSIL